MSEKTRRIERERALSLLYEAEMKDESIDDILAALPAAPAPFVIDIVVGVGHSAAELDEHINKHAIDWEVGRMAVLDRSLLRISTWEFLHRPQLSVAVIISEAVELAKQFSTDESGKFVNGILSAIAADVRSGQRASG